MFDTIKTYWQWYSSLGIMPHHDAVHKRKVRFCNRFLSLCILLIALLGLTEILTSKYWVLPMHLTRIAGLIIALYQLHKDRYVVSIYIALYTIFIFSIVGTIISPISNSFHFVAFPLCAIAFYFTEGRRGNLPFMVLNLIYFAAADYYNEHYLPNDSSLSHVFSIIIIFTVFYFVLGIYIWEARFFEKTIAQKNHNLSVQNKQLELQNEQMMELNKLKTNIFSILGHDLRSPFNNVVGFSGLLKRNFHKNSAEKNEHLIDLLVDSVQQTSQLIDDLLYWGRCQSERVEIKNEKINLSSLFHDLSLLYQNMTHTKGVFVHIGHLECKECICDRTILSIIIRNLFANAIKFTPKNGSITFTTTKTDKHITIVIVDTGLGMTVDKISQLENAQNNLSSLGTDNELGYGFGLTICSELSQKIDARINFESQLQKGTVAKIHLPLSATTT